MADDSPCRCCALQRPQHFAGSAAARGLPLYSSFREVQDEAMFRRLRWWQDIAARGRRIANETLGFLQLWRKSIQKVEGKHGVQNCRKANSMAFPC